MLGSEASFLLEQVRGISRRPKARERLIALQEELFVWRNPFDFPQGLELVERLSAKQKPFSPRSLRLGGEILF